MVVFYNYIFHIFICMAKIHCAYTDHKYCTYCNNSRLLIYQRLLEKSHFFFGETVAEKHQ